MMSNLEALKMYLETLEDIRVNVASIIGQCEYSERQGLGRAVSNLDGAIDNVKVVIMEREAAALDKWVATFAPEQVTA
jgi:hypothetical protein